MRSPLGARFPSRYLGAPLIAVLFCAACTADGGDTARDRPGRHASAAAEQPSPQGPDSHAETGSESSVREVEIADADRRRTVRGKAPAYVEIETAAVQGSIEVLRLRMTFAKRLPERMPDEKSVLRVSFMLTTKEGRRYTFDAQCVRLGWGAFASGGPEDAPIPKVTIEDARLELLVDPDYIGGLQPFDWIASVAWTSGTANYAFDSAPKSGLASFP